MLSISQYFCVNLSISYVLCDFEVVMIVTTSLPMLHYRNYLDRPLAFALETKRFQNSRDVVQSWKDNNSNAGNEKRVTSVKGQIWGIIRPIQVYPSAPSPWPGSRADWCRARQ